MGPAPGESVDAAAAGLLPRAVLQIFEEIDRISATHRCVVTIQCVEIYMDTVVDLLSPAESGLQVNISTTGRRDRRSLTRPHRYANLRREKQCFWVLRR